MARRHSSFLLRCWDLGSDEERIEVEHIQSGTKALLRSVAAAVEWICAHSGDATHQPEPVPEPTASTIDELGKGGRDD